MNHLAASDVSQAPDWFPPFAVTRVMTFYVSSKFIYYLFKYTFNSLKDYLKDSKET